MAGVASAEIGWCGQIWPCSGAGYTSEQNIDVYVQIWKDGVTSNPGQGADLGATLFYRCTGDPAFTAVPMTYNTDVGNNDEYTGTIPSTHGCSEVEFYVEAVDLTDMTYCYGQDQCGNSPNFFLPITEVTAQDVDVTFNLCLTEGVETSGEVCVTGGHEALTNWGDGVAMLQPCPDISPKLYQVTITFPAGSNSYVEYKYKKDDCATWESTGNHSFNIDDSSGSQMLWVDGWEYNEPDCPDCMTAAGPDQWGTIKGLFR
jgi:hypothetical protein